MATATLPVPSTSSPSAASTSTPSTATPSSTTPTSVATPSTGSSTPQATESPLGGKSASDFLLDQMTSALSGGTIKEEPAPAIGGNEAEEDPAAEETEAPAEETEAAEGETEAPADETAGTEDDWDLDLDGPGAISGKDLAAKLETKPEVMAALEELGVKDQIFAATRLAAKAVQYDEIFPGGPEYGRIAAESHNTFTGISDTLANVQPWGTPEAPISTQAAIRSLLEASALRNEDGTPQTRPDGSLITNGTVGKFLSNVARLRISQMATKVGEKNEFTEAIPAYLGELRKAAEAQGDEETLAAVDHLMERQRGSSTATRDEDGNDELSQRETQLRKDREDFERQKGESAQKASEAFESGIETKIDGKIDSAIKTILDKATGLTPFARKAAENELRTELAKAIRGDSYYRTEYGKLKALPQSENTAGKRVAEAVKALRTHLQPIARRVLAEAGATVEEKQAATEGRRTARREQTRSETRTAMGATGAGVQSSEQTYSQARETLAAKLGRQPDNVELLKFVAESRATKR